MARKPTTKPSRTFFDDLDDPEAKLRMLLPDEKVECQIGASDAWNDEEGKASKLAIAATNYRVFRFGYSTTAKGKAYSYRSFPYRCILGIELAPGTAERPVRLNLLVNESVHTGPKWWETNFTDMEEAQRLHNVILAHMVGAPVPENGEGAPEQAAEAGGTQ